MTGPSKHQESKKGPSRRLWIKSDQPETEAHQPVECRPISAQAAEYLPVDHRQLSGLAQPMGYQENFECIDRAFETLPPDDNMVTNYPLPLSSKPNISKKPAGHGSLDTSSDTGSADKSMMNRYPPRFDRSSDWMYASGESSITSHAQLKPPSSFSSQITSTLAPDFDNNGGPVQGSLLARNEQKRCISPYRLRRQLESSHEMRDPWNNAKYCYPQLAYPEVGLFVRLEGSITNHAQDLSVQGRFSNSAQSHDGFGKKPEGGLADLKHSSVPDEVPDGHARHTAPIEHHREVSYSKIVSEIGSNRNTSNDTAITTPTKLDPNVHSWSDGSITSQISKVPEVALIYEEQVQRAVQILESSIPRHIVEVGNAIQKRIDEVEEQFGPGFLQPFRPSHRVLEIRGIIEAAPSVPSHNYSCSYNYRGDATMAKNRSANTPDSDNCAIWISGLPAATTHTELLGAIRDVGKIYATVINPPTGNHSTSAAKIVFFERRQAERIMAQILNDQKFQIMGQTIRDVRWNKIKSAPYPYSEHSRVIRIMGPREVMDFEFFDAFFKARFKYELESRREVLCGVRKMVTHEWRFGSLRCQAASAKTAIERELRASSAWNGQRILVQEIES